MNRNRKHPDRAPHRHRAAGGDRTKNTRGFRITGSWNARPDRPAIIHTQDRRQVRRIARDMAAKEAYVIVEQHKGHGQWRTLYEVDGPAQVAAERETRAAAEREQRLAAEYAAQAARNELAARLAAEREHAALARLMVRPPVARAATGQATARHTAGGRR